MTRLSERLRKWRGPLTYLTLGVVLVLVIAWLWQNRALMVQVVTDLGMLKFALLVSGVSLAYFVGIVAFVTLVQSVGYEFTWVEGYHGLNLAQVAGTLPGGIWGLAGLAGWLWNRGVSRSDSALILILNLGFSLGACALFGFFAIMAALGWEYASLGLLPIGLWLAGRDALEKLRQRFLPATHPLPTRRAGFALILLNSLVWVVESACFTWLVLDQTGMVTVPPLFVASAYTAGYLVGYLVLIAPAGLGVREGVLVALLGNSIGADKALALALTFRLAQASSQWLHIFISWLFRFGIRRVQA